MVLVSLVLPSLVLASPLEPLPLALAEPDDPEPLEPEPEPLVEVDDAESPLLLPVDAEAEPVPSSPAQPPRGAWRRRRRREEPRARRRVEGVVKFIPLF